MFITLFMFSQERMVSEYRLLLTTGASLYPAGAMADRALLRVHRGDVRTAI